MPEKFTQTKHEPEVTASTGLMARTRTLNCPLVFYSLCGQQPVSGVQSFILKVDTRIETEQKAVSIQAVSVWAHSFLFSLLCMKRTSSSIGESPLLAVSTNIGAFVRTEVA